MILSSHSSPLLWRLQKNMRCSPQWPFAICTWGVYFSITVHTWLPLLLQSRSLNSEHIKLGATQAPRRDYAICSQAWIHVTAVWRSPVGNLDISFWRPVIITTTFNHALGMSYHANVACQLLISCWQLKYYDEWRKAHATAFSKALSHNSEIKRTSKSGKTVWSDPCTDWPRIWQEIATQLGPGVHTLANVDSILKTPRTSGSSCCIDAIDQWRTSIKGDLRKIPSPHKFFN